VDAPAQRDNDRSLARRGGGSDPPLLLSGAGPEVKIGGDAQPADLSVEARFAGEQAIIAVRGEANIESVRKLGAVFSGVIASGYRSVVLDVGELDVVDRALLHVIARTACRLVASGGELTIRSPTAMVTRTLDITWLSGRVSRDLRSGPPPHRLGQEQSAAVPVSHDGRAHAQAPRRVAAIPADHDVVDGALRLVVELAQMTVAGADGVSVSLRRHGRLATVAASNETVSAMDSDQYATGEGPCVDASVNGHWFHTESLDHETRWPAFTPRAKALGINAILSNPLMADGRPVGALNIYSRSPAVFTPKDQELAAAFATHASVVLADAGANVSDEELAGRQREALQVREIIALAQGVIMVREGVDQERAYATLRRSSRRASTTIRELAEEIVASAEWSQAPPDPRRREAFNADWPVGDLEQARRSAGLSQGELWLRYFELGGMCTALEVEAFVIGAARPSVQDHDLIADALSECHDEPGASLSEEARRMRREKRCR
jgi:anti-anti-sigma factor